MIFTTKEQPTDSYRCNISSVTKVKLILKHFHDSSFFLGVGGLTWAWSLSPIQRPQWGWGPGVYRRSGSAFTLSFHPTLAIPKSHIC